MELAQQNIIKITKKTIENIQLKKEINEMIDWI